MLYLLFTANNYRGENAKHFMRKKNTETNLWFSGQKECFSLILKKKDSITEFCETKHLLIFQDTAQNYPFVFLFSL